MRVGVLHSSTKDVAAEVSRLNGTMAYEVHVGELHYRSTTRSSDIAGAMHRPAHAQTLAHTRHRTRTHAFARARALIDALG